MKQMVSTEQIAGIKSDAQTIDLINQAIEDGEIEVGGDLYLAKFPASVTISSISYDLAFYCIVKEKKTYTKSEFFTYAKKSSNASGTSLNNYPILVEITPSGNIDTTINEVIQYVNFKTTSETSFYISFQKLLFEIEDGAIKITRYKGNVYSNEITWGNTAQQVFLKIE